MFQGDSITDAGRDRDTTAPNVPQGLGEGYVRDAAAMLWKKHDPQALHIYNRGISGDRITHLHKRWKRDCLTHRPTVVSILVGVNDVWHGFSDDPAGGVSLEAHQSFYRQLLDITIKALPDVRLVIGQPFAMPAGPVLTLPIQVELQRRDPVIRYIAKDFGAVFVPYQEVFDAAMKSGTAPDALAGDGVHPTQLGHQLMAQAWCDAVGIEPA